MDALIQWLTTTLKVARFPAAAIVIAAGTLLFAPAAWTSALGLEQAVADNRAVIGLSFFLCSATLVTEAGRQFLYVLRLGWRKFQVRRNLAWTIKNLTQDEKSRLRPFVIEDKATAYYDPFDGVAVGLCRKGILFRPLNYGHLHGVAFNIQPPARTYLLKNPHLLEEAPGEE